MSRRGTRAHPHLAEENRSTPTNSAPANTGHSAPFANTRSSANRGTQQTAHSLAQQTTPFANQHTAPSANTATQHAPLSVAQQTPPSVAQQTAHSSTHQTTPFANQHTAQSANAATQHAPLSVAQQTPPSVAPQTAHSLAHQTTPFANQHTAQSASQQTPAFANQHTAPSANTATQHAPQFVVQQTPPSVAPQTAHSLAHQTTPFANQHTAQSASQQTTAFANQRTAQSASQQTPAFANQRTAQSANTATQHAPLSVAQQTELFMAPQEDFSEYSPTFFWPQTDFSEIPAFSSYPQTARPVQQPPLANQNTVTSSHPQAARSTQQPARSNIVRSGNPQTTASSPLRSVGHPIRTVSGARPSAPARNIPPDDSSNIVLVTTGGQKRKRDSDPRVRKLVEDGVLGGGMELIPPYTTYELRELPMKRWGLSASYLKYCLWLKYPNSEELVPDIFVCKVCVQTKGKYNTFSASNRHFPDSHLEGIHNIKGDAPSPGGQREEVTDAQKAEYQRLFIEWVASSLLPLNAFQTPACHRFFEAICGNRFMPPSRNTFNKNLETLYKSIQEKLKEQLTHAEHVHLTLDLWTAPQTSDNYLGITIHWFEIVVVNGKEESREYTACLYMGLFTEKKSGKNLAIAVDEILKHYDIVLKVRTITTDGTGNMKSFGNEIERMHPHIKHRICLAHGLQLCLKDLSKISDNEPELEDEEDVTNLQDDFERDTSVLVQLRPVEQETEDISVIDEYQINTDEAQDDGDEESSVQESRERIVDVPLDPDEEPLDREEAELAEIQRQISVQMTRNEQEAVRTYKDVMKKVKRLVTFLKKSTVAAKELAEQCRSKYSFGSPIPQPTSRRPPLIQLKGNLDLNTYSLGATTVKQECEIRFNTRFYMLQRLAILKDAIKQTRKNVKGRTQLKRPNTLNAKEWYIVYSLLALFEPFEIATRHLSSEEHASVPRIYSAFLGILNKLKEMRDTDIIAIDKKFIGKNSLPNPDEDEFEEVNKMRKSLAAILMKKISKRFLGQDPLDKDMDLHQTLIDIFDDRRKTDLKAAAIDPKTWRSKNFGEHVDAVVSKIRHGFPFGGTPPDRMEQAESDDELIDMTKIPAIPTQQSAQEQTARSLEEEFAEFQNEFRSKHLPLVKWWVEHREAYPRLSRITFPLLMSQATSTPAERLFSRSGHLLSARRTRMASENVEMMTFCSQNLYLQH